MIILVILAGNLFTIIPLNVIASVDPVELSTTAGTINGELQDKFFRDRISGKGFLGVGLYEGNAIAGDTNKYIEPNTVGYGALFTRFGRSGNSECKTWAETDVKPVVTSLIFGDVDAFLNPDNLYYTEHQGIALEFLSLGYEYSKDQALLQNLINLYNAMPRFKASGSALYGKDGAYWRALVLDTDGQKKTGAGYDYCYANASFWAIIGMLNFGETVKGSTADQNHNFSGTSVLRSKQTIQFLEDFCFYNGSGFREYPYAELVEPEDKFVFNTQVLAVLAYTRLYQATNEQAYLDKANMMVEYIITKNFLRTGDVGGYVSYISASNPMDVSHTRLGYDNALYAYTLINLYAATGETDIRHLRRAEEIAHFMNTHLYQRTSDGALVGYCETLVNNTISGAYRYFVTNALMLIVNEEIIYHERPWFIRYLLWIIIGSIAIAVIIGIVIAVKKKGQVGKKLPKLVKGLVDNK